MLLKFVIGFLLILFSAVNIQPQEIKERTEEIIKSALGKDVTFEMIKYKIPPDIKRPVEQKSRQAFFDESIYIYKTYRNKKQIGYAILDNVYGKSMPITFLVIYDLNGNIISSGIVKYREPYGGGVASKNWNEQFAGKNSTSGYDDISNISGATISVNSVTKGIQKLTLLLHEIKDKI